MIQYNRNYIENRGICPEIEKKKIIFNYNKVFILIAFLVLLYLLVHA